MGDRAAPDAVQARWVTLQDVYRCTVEPHRIATMLDEVEKNGRGRFPLPQRRGGARAPKAKRRSGKGLYVCRSRRTDRGSGVAAWSEDTEKALRDLKGEWEIDRVHGAGRAGRLRLAAVRRWFTHDWSKLDKKVATTIVEGLSVFLSVFDSAGNCGGVLSP